MPEGQTVWGCVVHIFDLAGHPTATRAYAWSSPIEGSTKRRFFAVLHTERINSPVEAVRASKPGLACNPAARPHPSQSALLNDVYEAIRAGR